MRLVGWLRAIVWVRWLWWGLKWPFLIGLGVWGAVAALYAIQEGKARHYREELAPLEEGRSCEKAGGGYVQGHGRIIHMEIRRCEGGELYILPRRRGD